MTPFGLKDLPEDNPLNRVYRYSAGALGAGLPVFGILGFSGGLGFFELGAQRDLGGRRAGPDRRGGPRRQRRRRAERGRRRAVLLSGLVNLTLLRTSANFLNFSMRNVIFSFVSGLLLLTFGLYGRVSGGLPPDDPFYRARHGRDPSTGEIVDARKAGLSPRAGTAAPALRAGDESADPRQLPGAATADPPAPD